MFGRKTQETCTTPEVHYHTWGKWNIVMKDVQYTKESRTNTAPMGSYISQDVTYEWRPTEHQERQCSACGLTERYAVAVVTTYTPYLSTQTAGQYGR